MGVPRLDAWCKPPCRPCLLPMQPLPTQPLPVEPPPLLTLPRGQLPISPAEAGSATLGLGSYRNPVAAEDQKLEDAWRACSEIFNFVTSPSIHTQLQTTQRWPPPVPRRRRSRRRLPRRAAGAARPPSPPPPLPATDRLVVSSEKLTFLHRLHTPHPPPPPLQPAAPLVLMPPPPRHRRRGLRFPRLQGARCGTVRA